MWGLVVLVLDSTTMLILDSAMEMAQVTRHGIAGTFFTGTPKTWILARVVVLWYDYWVLARAMVFNLHLFCGQDTEYNVLDSFDIQFCLLSLLRFVARQVGLKRGW